jgi:hypothetical protein
MDSDNINMTLVFMALNAKWPMEFMMNRDMEMTSFVYVLGMIYDTLYII